MIKVLKWSETEPEMRKLIMRRAQADMEAIQDDVTRWISRVREDGDRAVLDYIRKFDCADFEISRLKVSREDIEAAYKAVSKKFLQMLKEQIRIAREFHEGQAARIERQWQIETVPGVVTGFRKVPIEACGLYVPAGKAPLPTVAQILTVAATAAGVPRKVVCFAPTARHDEIIVAADLAGADEIYRVGGIAAIAALAYGTETIRPVNKIVGPGNPYVQAAKLQVFGQVGIDMLSGPSEALIMADATADPRYLAADILARCEHGPDSAGVLVTCDEMLAKRTRMEIERQFSFCTRRKFVKEALAKYSALVLVNSEAEMIAFANEYSAEHLEIQMSDPEGIFAQIRNAGSVFLGNFAPVAVGDYASGTNHCLPTGAAVKYSSPIGPETFLKTIEFQKLTRDGLDALKPIVQTISDSEGLDAHKRSVEIRFEKNESA